MQIGGNAYSSNLTGKQRRKKERAKKREESKEKLKRKTKKGCKDPLEKEEMGETGTLPAIGTITWAKEVYKEIPKKQKRYVRYFLIWAMLMLFMLAYVTYIEEKTN